MTESPITEPTHSPESETPRPVTARERASEFWRRNKIILLHLPILIGLLIGGYTVLKAWDARIGVEGFGDLFGYGLNAVRITLIIFTAWWFKKTCWFDFYSKTELDLFDAAKLGNRDAFWMRVWDRCEWTIALAFATYWYTR